MPVGPYLLAHVWVQTHLDAVCMPSAVLQAAVLHGHTCGMLLHVVDAGRLTPNLPASMQTPDAADLLDVGGCQCMHYKACWRQTHSMSSARKSWLSLQAFASAALLAPCQHHQGAGAGSMHTMDCFEVAGMVQAHTKRAPSARRPSSTQTRCSSTTGRSTSGARCALARAARSAFGKGST